MFDEKRIKRRRFQMCAWEEVLVSGVRKTKGWCGGGGGGVYRKNLWGSGREAAAEKKVRRLMALSVSSQYMN